MALRRSSAVKASAVAVIASLIVTLAIVAEGFDVAQTPVNDSGIWALQAGDGNRYARINTELHEIDTVKAVVSPTALVQTDSAALLVMEGNERVATVDAGRPRNLDDESPELESTPTGTVEVISGGDFIGYRNENGRISVARIDDGAGATPATIDPYAEENAGETAVQRTYKSDSFAIGPDGILYSYSVEERAVLRIDLASNSELGSDNVPDGPGAAGTTITAVGERWAVLSADGETLWIRGNDSVATRLADDAVLQQPTDGGDAVLLASNAGLISAPISGADPQAVVGGAGSVGVPAAPVGIGGVMYAAWLSENDTAGVLWTSERGEGELDYAGDTMTASPVPVLRTNGSRVILNDTESGWVWTLPDGELVASSQDWGIATASQDKSNEDIEQASQVIERKPPVATADQFGVRAGQLVLLPVLLNDHDPNEDALTIDPASVQQPGAQFGTVTTTNNSQDLAIQVSPTATGTLSFTYWATDGSQVGGMNSEPATVTLTVFDAGVNTAPVWCGVAECQREWPRMQVQPGGSSSVEVLRGWVDPEGDPIYVSSVRNLSEVGTVAASPDGAVVFQHPDAAATTSEDIEVTVTVSDIHGAVAARPLIVQVTPTPSLSVEPFAVLASAGELLTVDPRKFITGISGSYLIESAKSEADDGAAITVNNGGRTFGFTAADPGNYLVTYAVKDSASEVISTVRVTVLSTAELALTTSPITVFVRPKADATVDVFTAVSNPANKVLLLTQALPTPINGASLDVEVVNQRLLRVKGATANGQPGVLGMVRYTVSDGTGNALSTAIGEATVILLPIPTPQAPIAVADAITVRVGAQIDIPVLDNDLAPDGNSLMLNPEAVLFDAGDGLAFAAGSSLRYLAPEVEGSYEISYTVYTAGSPHISASALVRITVLGPGDNRAPEPRTLVGRVLAGSTVEIPFDSFGIDPDGDAVILDRISTQPASGSATITATGDAIAYTSVPGFSGPVEFRYRVSDTFGESGTANVRVGVLDDQSDPRPITFSDYVEVQAGTRNQVTVQPAANDLDPAGKTLEVIDVVPDAPAGTEEYDDLAELLRGDITENVVTIAAGTTLGSRSFYYTVRNTSGDLGIGLIVVKVVRDSVPDRPRISDTYLTIDDRSTFPSGIDVVTGKVTWNSGDINSLTLKLWNADSGYSVAGWRIRGALPDESAIVPFELSGTNVLGEEVSTYGFLRIPGKDEVILALKPGAGPQRVAEGESVSFDMNDLMSIPADEHLVIDGDSLATAGLRQEAGCTLDGDSTITYTAGDGAPWVDFCAITLQLAGQGSTTRLVVSIAIEPEQPLPILGPAALTLSPAAPPIVYDLRRMTGWAGKEDNESLEYVINYTGDQFAVTQDGFSLTINALDAANPGRENSVRVSLSSHPDVSSSALSLKVGPAPTDLPQGGTVAKECSQAGSSNSCLITVTGIAGEVNVYGTPLVLVSVGSTAACNDVTMTVEDSSQIRATWTTDAPGGTCETTFVVKDAQGQLSPDERNGTVLLDLQGFPKAPASVVQSNYDDGMVRLAVTPGGATSAYPDLTGFAIYQGGSKVANCSAAGVCDELHGLTNGDQLQYEARAVNAVGESKASVFTTAWSYAKPQIGTVTRTRGYTDGQTSETSGVVDIQISGSDTTVKEYLITGAGSPVSRTGASTSVAVTLPVGEQFVVVTAVSEVPIPSGTGPIADNDSELVEVAGLPVITSVGTVGAGSSSSLVVTGATFSLNHGDPVTKKYIAYTGTVDCAAAADGGYLAPSATGASFSVSDTPTISGLTEWESYQVVSCVWNGFGVAVSVPQEGTPYDISSIPVPADYTYAVSDGSSNGEFLIQAPTSPNPEPTHYNASFTNYPGTLWGQDPEIYVQFCRTFGGSGTTVCGGQVKVLPALAANVFQVKVDSIVLPACTVGSALVAAIGSPSAVSGSTSSYEYTFQDVTILPEALVTWFSGSGDVPVGATYVRSAVIDVSWPSTTYAYQWTSPSTPVACA